jgi:hypothetical protein
MLGDMAISEAARSDLYHGLRDLLGDERAETLMSAIPLHDLDEVATKGDIADLRAEMKTDIAELKVDIVTQVGALQRTTAAWMLTLLVAVIGAIAGVGLLS